MRHALQGTARFGAAALIASTVLLAAGCGSAGQAQHGGSTLRVNERDFKISAGSQIVRPGKVDIAVDNRGPEAHELIVVREDGHTLPMRKDGVTVDEDALQKQEAGSLEPGEPGADRHLDLNLQPGRYILFCNMTGHYLGGMHTELVVG
jgi:uncharacterized cupredoxin-like copper-binding protein